MRKTVPCFRTSACGANGGDANGGDTNRDDANRGDASAPQWSLLHGGCRCRIAQRKRCRTFDPRTQRQDRADHGKPQDLRPVHSFILHPMSRRQRTLIVRSHGASLDMRGLNAA
jgi:hypothetical protein